MVPSWSRMPSGVCAVSGSEASMMRVISVTGLFVVPGWVVMPRLMSSVKASARSWLRCGSGWSGLCVWSLRWCVRRRWVSWSNAALIVAAVSATKSQSRWSSPDSPSDIEIRLRSAFGICAPSGSARSIKARISFAHCSNLIPAARSINSVCNMTTMGSTRGVVSLARRNA